MVPSWSTYTKPIGAIAISKWTWGISSIGKVSGHRPLVYKVRTGCAANARAHASVRAGCAAAQWAIADALAWVHGQWPHPVCALCIRGRCTKTFPSSIYFCISSISVYNAGSKCEKPFFTVDVQESRVHHVRWKIKKDRKPKKKRKILKYLCDSDGNYFMCNSYVLSVIY